VVAVIPARTRIRSKPSRNEANLRARGPSSFVAHLILFRAFAACLAGCALAAVVDEVNLTHFALGYGWAGLQLGVRAFVYCDADPFRDVRLLRLIQHGRWVAIRWVWDRRCPDCGEFHDDPFVLSPN
jgi:hypothetical protein